MKRAPACALVTFLALAGCASTPDETSPSVDTTTRSATPSSAPEVDEEQAVVDAAMAYYLATDEMFTTGVLDMDAMHQVAEEPYATEAATEIDSTINPGFRMTGEPGYETESVVVDGDTATVATCVDWTAVTFVSGDVVSAEGDAGVNELILSSASGAWRVVGAASGGPCAASSE